ncbi:hypothetical protein BOX15_Mlig028674g2, partial [Macrostomum lignano]
LRRHPQACSSSAAAPSSSGTPKMPAKKAPKPRKFFMQLTKDSWTTSATPPMPPPLPSAMKPVQSPPRDEDSPGWRTEQFLMPADCFQLLQRTTDPQLRAIELLTQCRVRIYSDSGVEQPDCSRLTVRYRDRCGDPRTCERLLNSLLARRQPRGAAAARLQQLPSKPSPSALPVPAASASAAADAFDAVRLTACLGAIAEDILRGSSFVHCCGVASAAFAKAEYAALRGAGSPLRLPEEQVLSVDAASAEFAASCPSSSSCHYSSLRQPLREVRLAWHRFASIVRVSPAHINLGVAMATIEDSKRIAATIPGFSALPSARCVGNLQLPSQPQPFEQEADDDEADEDVLGPLPVAQLLRSLPIGLSVVVGAEMLTRF